MTRENKTENPTEKRNDYAFLVPPGGPGPVTYSLPIFHDIDFAVNEGYRKIPHGGIEEGGLLFGTIDESGTRVEAFRPIACEHSSGPSFLLSDQDLAQLTAQINGGATDEDLQGLEVVGWFLAHTRGPLTLTDREVELCDHYFPHPGMVTVLVKPERFQPTRFGFLVRGANGSLSRDGAQNAIILPLPGRNVKASQGPIASIPAPAPSPIAARRAAEAEIAAEAQAKEVEEPTQAAVTEPVAPVVPPTPPSPRPATPARPPNRSARRQRLNLEQVRPKEGEVEEGPTHLAANESVGTPVPEEAATESQPALPMRNNAELEPVRRAEWPPAAVRRSFGEEDVDLMPDPYRQMELLNQKKPVSTRARFVMVLPLAALLGCLVGYVAYLQVPPPIIPLAVKSRGENLVVTWPAEQTRSATYAAVRVDDGTPLPLTPEEKIAGRVEVEAHPDMKVELIAYNWLHDSRGIVHFVKPVANTAP